MNGEHKTLCNQFIYTFCITTCILFYPFSYFRKIVRDKNLFIMRIQIKNFRTFSQLYHVAFSSILKLITIFFRRSFYHNVIYTSHRIV